MKNKSYRSYFLWAFLGTVAASAYPIGMAVRVALWMIRDGAVPEASYPKYVIPYVPIALALILGVLLMPLFQKLSRKWDLLFGGLFASGVFLAAERIMETKILVRTVFQVPLEGWQLSLCYIPPDEFQSRTWEAVDVLLGGYTPGFKLHFYLISLVLVWALLNALYGFGKMVRDGEYGRKKALTVQAVCAALFLGMCIWACFTAFYRSGEMTVSPLSAVLMAAFFILLGVTVGLFAGSLTLGKKPLLSVWLPSIAAVLTTMLMYVGEMVLLSGNLYRFGTGFFFERMVSWNWAAFAPADILVILLSGLLTGCICRGLRKRK